MKIDINKAFVAVTSVFIAFLSWFGKITYDKLTKIETDVQALLVASGIDRTEIQNLKDRINTAPGSKKPVSYVHYHKEFIMPDEVLPKKKKLIFKS
jgi:hypothetical protein